MPELRLDGSSLQLGQHVDADLPPALDQSPGRGPQGNLDHDASLRWSCEVDPTERPEGNAASEDVSRVRREDHQCAIATRGGPAPHVNARDAGAQPHGAGRDRDRRKRGVATEAARLLTELVASGSPPALPGGDAVAGRRRSGVGARRVEAADAVRKTGARPARGRSRDNPHHPGNRQRRSQRAEPHRGTDGRSMARTMLDQARGREHPGANRPPGCESSATRVC